MLIGGALGNIVDRVRAGSVTDFVKLPLGWPPFNLADSVDHARHRCSCSCVIDHARRQRRAVSDAVHDRLRGRAPARRSTRTPGVVVHPARGHREDTLAQLLAGSAAGGEPERAGIVHRLDRDTSGPARRVALGGGPRGCCRRRSPSGEIEREYLALVEGRPPARSGTIEAPIGRDPRVRTRMTVGGAHAREARTALHARARAVASTSLLRLRLETGRTHQIRVHLQAIGHPVAGDPEYGTRRPARSGAPVPARHAPGLRPSDQRRARSRSLSPLPADLQARDWQRAERLS